MPENAPVSGSPEPGHSPSGTGIPVWVLVLYGVLLAGILAVGGATLYLVAGIDDRNAQIEQTAKTARATRALLRVVAARQLESKDVPAKVEAALEDMQKLLADTQDAIDATNAVVAATNQTLDETNALLDSAEAAAAKAQQSAAALEARVSELGQGRQQLSKSLDAQLAKIQDRLAAVEARLAALGPNR